MVLHSLNSCQDRAFERMHPLFLFVFFFIIMLLTMFSSHPLFLGISFTMSVIYLFFYCEKSVAIRNMKLAIGMICLVSIGNVLLTHNGSTVFIYLNHNALTLEALLRGLDLGTVIATEILWMMSANQLIHMDHVLYLFGRILPTTSLTCSMILRYLPLLQTRQTMISDAATACGRKTKNTLFVRAAEEIREFSILLSWSLEASIDTGDSMEARGYRLPGRTNYSKYHWKKKDIVLFIFLVSLGTMVGIILLSSEFSIYFYPRIILPAMHWKSYICLMGLIVYLCIPFYVELSWQLLWNRIDGGRIS